MTLYGTTTPGQSGSNNNEGVTPGSLAGDPELSLTTGCSLMSYPGHPFCGGGTLSLCRRYNQRIQNLTDRMREEKIGKKR